MGRESRRELMARLAELRGQLARFDIRGTPDYAEVLVAEALDSERVANAVNQGYDVRSRRFGRVEVKCRVLPCDGRRDDRVDLRDAKAGGFDHLAIVIFSPDYSVNGAVIVPYGQAWPIVDARKYRRISYAEACQLEGATDITELVAAAAER